MHESTRAGRDPQRRPGFRRAGVFLAAAGTAALLAACSGSPASTPPAPAGGHLYWTNGYCICRASLNGTGVNQKFITVVPYGTGIAVSSGYLYWANSDELSDGSATSAPAR